MAVGDGEEVAEINLFMAGGQPEGQVGPEHLPLSTRAALFLPVYTLGTLGKNVSKRAALL